MLIELGKLPKDIRDQIELKEATDMTFSRFADEDYSDYFWNLLSERSDPNVEHSIICSIVGTQGSGKSLSAISMACYMTNEFNVDNIYFGYDQLVYNRHKLKPNSVVIVDEQSEQYGLDSHRISVILQNLKEQLRKKSIHFFFCAPVLYPESKSSMYIIETMFIDFQTQECYAALKTRDNLTLGHIRIPHPLKILGDGRSLATKELIAAYQAKKDEHLEKVLGQKNMDIFEERAEQVMQHALFLKAEKIYKKKMGYIPQSTVVQIINKIYPEYQAGVVPLEIAGRIRLDKELSGDWDISGRGSKRRKG
jgi:ABC-type dipeptide/oligopeptide/nickel transport system ATPase component